MPNYLGHPNLMLCFPSLHRPIILENKNLESLVKKQVLCHKGPQRKLFCPRKPTSIFRLRVVHSKQLVTQLEQITQKDVSHIYLQIPTKTHETITPKSPASCILVL